MPDIKKTLVKLEKQFWNADKDRDSNFYKKNTTGKSVAVGQLGVANKKMILKMMSSNPQKLLSYTIQNPRAISLTNDVALLIYKAAGTTVNKGKKSRFSALATSAYVRTKGKWLAAFHQQIQLK
ncbi:nuclear transport factor 2 family protein [Candidatus Woesearchaeota archaeon]|nr:nuclear transport factor 2 family protein [Candidatus Woesearchaeota archaeon]